MSVEFDSGTEPFRVDPTTRERLAEWLADPACRLAIRIRDGQGRTALRQCWVRRDAAAVLLPLPDQQYEVTPLHPTFLPEWLARLVWLGPRPRLPDSSPVPVTLDLVDQLTDPDPGRRAAAAGELPIRGEAIQVDQDWVVVSTWRAGDGKTSAQAVRVLDTPAGLWFVAADQGQVALRPTNPTAVWRRLLGLLPIGVESGPLPEPGAGNPG